MSAIQRLSTRRERLAGRELKSYLTERLKNARSYKRIAGYFRSSILELVGEEIEGVEDVRIICNSELDPHDLRVSQVAEVALKAHWNAIPAETEAILYREHYRSLYRLLVSGKVQIRVVPRDVVFVHGKAGVITGKDGARTAFLGSVNETFNAFTKSYEILWEDTSREGCDWIEEEFDALWEQGRPLPEAIIDEVKRVAERYEVTFAEIDDPQEMPAAAMAEAPIYRGGEQLQPWQRSFVSIFLTHREIYGKARLLIADEVGLGKTLSMATAALVANLLDDGPVLILCPATLTLQWQTELKDRLGIPSAVWVSNQKHWLDPDARVIQTRGAQDVARCPFQIAIVSTGLVVHNSEESKVLRKLKLGTLVLDEAHKARVRGTLGNQKGEDNNLLAFMKEAAQNARHVLLGTATPIQTDPKDLWQLMAVLNSGVNFVMGASYSSSWPDAELTHPLVTGNAKPTSEEEVWELLRSPLPAVDTPMMDDNFRGLVQKVRSDLNLPEDEFFSAEAVTTLNLGVREFRLQPAIETDIFRHNNPFVRHVVLRRRKALEDEGLLDRVAVDVHPDPQASAGTYAGVTFEEGGGLMTNFTFDNAYRAAEDFIKLLAARVKGASLLRSVFLQRICSSFASGRLTVERMLKREVEEELWMGEGGALAGMTDKEIELLEDIRRELSREDAVDPKLAAVRWFLSEFHSDGKMWAEHGCIIFSQYFDTANWVASELAKDFPDGVIAVYAGAGKSGLYRGPEFVAVQRDAIKEMVKRGEVKLVVATDAACEGLNLQTLGTLINIDLPWNPSRLEQRLGRIKRFGQARATVDMLNLCYHGTRDKNVYEKLSERMKDRFDIFGGLPDCIDADWIEDIEDYLEQADTHLHLRKNLRDIFQDNWGKTIAGKGERWEACTRVLSRQDIYKKVAAPW